MNAASEHHEQALLVQHLTLRGIGFFAVPNGARLAGRSRDRARQWKWLEREGVRKGAPDLVVTRFSRDGRPIVIEMKNVKSGRVSTEQKLMHAHLEKEGWAVVVAFGYVEAIEKLRDLGVPV